jgi:hypothetical protein
MHNYKKKNVLTLLEADGMVVRRNLSSDLKFKQRRLREGMRVYSLNGERESKL